MHSKQSDIVKTNKIANEFPVPLFYSPSPGQFSELWIRFEACWRVFLDLLSVQVPEPDGFCGTSPYWVSLSFTRDCVAPLCALETRCFRSNWSYIVWSFLVLSLYRSNWSYCALAGVIVLKKFSPNVVLNELSIHSAHPQEIR